jgi:gamma-glutamylcyclotransferase (GGCT)/AIG2-like uncharacterized protein YtfP
MRPGTVRACPAGHFDCYDAIMVSALFVYGTLECGEVVEALTGALPRSLDAVAQGYRRGMLAERRYPGIVLDDEAEVVGRVYFDLDDASMAVIDSFEADEYERREITVECAGPGAIQVYAYVVDVGYADLVTADPWNLAAFRRLHLDEYVRGCEELRRFELSKKRDDL